MRLLPRPDHEVSSRFLAKDSFERMLVASASCGVLHWAQRTFKATALAGENNGIKPATMDKAIPVRGERTEAAWRSMVARTFFFLLVLSNLLPSLTALEWREETVIAVAAAALLFLVPLMQRSLFVSNLGEIVVVALFATLAIAQPYFLGNGALDFGIKWALTFLATFVPYWVARSIGRMQTPGLERTVANAIGLLFVITTTTILASYLFDKGEVHVQPSGVIRAFGWLGDSVSPVFVFFIFYYLFRKQYAIAALGVAALLMTFAKTALLMLILSPAVFVFAAASMRAKVALSSFYFVVLFGAITFAGPIFEQMSDLLQADYSYYTRILSIYSGLDYFSSAPLTGIGINQSLSFIESDAREHANSMGIGSYFDVLHIDNPIVRVAAETGLVGLALLFVFLYRMLRAAFGALRAGGEIVNPRERAIVMASSLWVIGFILFHQTTGWFEAGHPQLGWLLLFSVLADLFYRRSRTQAFRASGTKDND